MQLRDGLFVCISTQQRAGDGLIGFRFSLSDAIALSLKDPTGARSKHLLGGSALQSLGI
jgi:hypothetical protein